MFPLTLQDKNSSKNEYLKQFEVKKQMTTYIKKKCDYFTFPKIKMMALVLT